MLHNIDFFDNEDKKKIEIVKKTPSECSKYVCWMATAAII